MTRVLLSHGLIDNLGDMGMIAGLMELYGGMPGARVSLTAKAGMQLRIRDADRVHGRVPLEFKAIWHPRWPNRFANLLYRVPRLWRWAPRAKQALDELLTRRKLQWCDRPIAWELVASGHESLAEIADEFDVLHLVGGGYFCDAFARCVFEQCSLIHAFRRAGKRVILTGQQVGPLANRPTLRAVIQAMRRAEFVGVRDPLSLETCRAAGLEQDRASVTGDDSLGLQADVAAGADALRKLALEPRSFLAINLRQARYAGSSDDDLVRFARLVKAVQELLPLPLLVVPIALHAEDSDGRAGRRLAELLPGADVQELDTRSMTAEAVKGVLASAALAMGVSYHFVTFARSCGVPAAAVYSNPYYAHKARGAARFWASGVEAISLREADPGEAARRIVHLHDEADVDELHATAVAAAARWRETVGDVVGVAAGCAADAGEELRKSPAAGLQAAIGGVAVDLGVWPTRPGTPVNGALGSRGFGI